MTGHDIRLKLEKLLRQRGHGIITEGELTEKLVELLTQAADCLDKVKA
jgi:hypothetical protein